METIRGNMVDKNSNATSIENSNRNSDKNFYKKFRQNFEQNDSVIIPWLYLPGIAEFRSH